MNFDTPPPVAIVTIDGYLLCRSFRSEEFRLTASDADRQRVFHHCAFRVDAVTLARSRLDEFRGVRIAWAFKDPPDERARAGFVTRVVMSASDGGIEVGFALNGGGTVKCIGKIETKETR